MMLKALSDKQIALMIAVAKGDGAGDFADIDQVLERLPYKTSKQSLQFSIRSLLKRGLLERKPIEVRRGRARRPLALTPRGYSMLRDALQRRKKAQLGNLGAQGSAAL